METEQVKNEQVVTEQKKEEGVTQNVEVNTAEIIDKISQEIKSAEQEKLNKIREEIETKTKEELLRIIKDTQDEFKKKIEEYENRLAQLNQQQEESQRKGVVREPEPVVVEQPKKEQSPRDIQMAWEEFEKAVLSGKFK